MRVGAVLLRHKPRMPQNENKVPFVALLPLGLKNSISGKENRGSQVACLEEMAVMFSCLKANEFNEALCPKEVGGFQKCYSMHRQAESEKRELEKKGLLVPGERKLAFRQVNQVLKDYPSVKTPVTHK